MEKKEPFGSQYAKTFDIGDIVAWSTWCGNKNCYIDHTGILISLEVEIIGDREVSMAKVTSINESKEIEIFTINLKVVSKAKMTD